MGNEGAKFSSGKEKPAINIAYAIIKGSDLEPTWDIDQYFLERLFLMFQPKTGSNVWDLTTTKKFFETLYKCLDIVTKQPSGGAANLTPGNMTKAKDIQVQLWMSTFCVENSLSMIEFKHVLQMTVKAEISIVVAGCSNVKDGKAWSAATGFYKTLQSVTKGEMLVTNRNDPRAEHSKVFGCFDNTNNGNLARMTVVHTEVAADKAPTKPWEKLTRRSLVFVVDLMATEENLRKQHSFVLSQSVYHDIEHMVFDNWTQFWQSQTNPEILQERNEARKSQLKKDRAEELCRKFLHLPKGNKWGASNNVAIMPYYVDHEEPSSVSEAWKKIRESNQMRELIHNVIGEMQ